LFDENKRKNLVELSLSYTTPAAAIRKRGIGSEL
jgi:hypothetical protein